MTSQEVLFEVKDATAFITMNRPGKHNAMRFEDLDRIVEFVRAAEDDDDVKVIVLRGNGPSFCAGHDYNDAIAAYGLEYSGEGQKPRRPSQRARLLRDRWLGERYKAILYSMKPVIAQVHGVCTGLGMYFVELADLAVCATNTKFSHAEQRLGLAGNTWHLNHQLLTYGPKVTRELMLLGDDFGPEDARGWGLVNRVVPDDQLDAEVAELAGRIAHHARDSLVTGKAMWNMTLDSLGGAEQFTRGYLGHTLGTNLRIEPDEFNFLRERRAHGTTDAFKNRNAYHGA